ncbi:MAG: DNA-deoxyinosine glycosylase [Clostridia bacterium]|nr:DNA-deoxyinosine glycosylase [Clostridia bacterium]
MDVRNVLITTHPIPPFYDKNSRVLILGSFPSVKSREQLFFYAHPQNRFWKVLAAVFNCPAPESVDEKKLFLLKHRIALWDAVASCTVVGSADSSIKNARPNDISSILKNADIERIFANGKAAEKYYNRLILPFTGRTVQCLPSTSPANAAYSAKQLLQAWQIVKC